MAEELCVELLQHYLHVRTSGDELPSFVYIQTCINDFCGIVVKRVFHISDIRHDVVKYVSRKL